jgi:hypothetical protein
MGYYNYYTASKEDIDFAEECISAIKVKIDSIKKNENAHDEHKKTMIRRLELSMNAIKYYYGLD